MIYEFMRFGIIFLTIPMKTKKEVKIYTTTEGIEPVSAMLLETGVTGIQVEDDRELKEYLNTSSEFWDYVDEELLNKPIGETKVTVYVSENPYGPRNIFKY